METLVPLVISGIVRGCAYALIAVGFTVIYSSTQVLNFAQGEFLMLGSMTTFFALSALGLPLFAAIGVALAVGAGAAWLLHRGLVAPLSLRGASTINVIIATLAFGLVARQGAGLAISQRPEAVPEVVSGAGIQAGLLRLDAQNLLLLGCTAAVTAALWYFFSRTAKGLQVRAIGYNAEAARAIGLNVPQLVLATFVVSGLVAAAAGVLVSATTGASAYMGFDFGVKGFAAAIIGGLTNPLAGVLGGLALGVLESVGQLYLPDGYGEALPFAALLLALIIRPTGLLTSDAEAS